MRFKIYWKSSFFFPHSLRRRAFLTSRFAQKINKLGDGPHWGGAQDAGGAIRLIELLC